ncbi:NAD(P)-binding protein [Polychaeton citri CBS 116435]|uniref:NAD(P)-binding protein n=1 Tax=Polychaeton citri CBS 116435 TaxID=1314669 RepID=A0A9P4QG27_9PEZI|nr:NAD(P)-binding protein [Polychaeton citri CBS 116435]
MASVIVFGPTGQIGSVTARTAAEYGAKVWLAMRDTSKAIPGLGKDLEAAGDFHRVRADLQDTETVSQAVKTSGAKRAFVYLVHGAPDHMKAALEAMKSAGIEFVVFISSFTIDTDKGLREISSTELIPYVHAQVEANLDDIFGSDQYVAMRPGAFATNLLQERKGIAAGQVLLYGGEFQQDNINPSDIGRASGNILVSGPRNGQKKVYLYGPEILSLHDSVVQIGRILQRDLKVTALGAEEAWNNYISSGLPEPYAKYMIQVLSTKGPDKGFGERFPSYDEGVNNVKLYTGRPSTSLEEWVRENEAEFST